MAVYESKWIRTGREGMNQEELKQYEEFVIYCESFGGKEAY